MEGSFTQEGWSGKDRRNHHRNWPQGHQSHFFIYKAKHTKSDKHVNAERDKR
jgi:hypothetical protein